MEMSRPRVIISAAITIDGKIATRTGDSGISSQPDKARVHRLRAKTDAILVGRNTIMEDDPLLSVRYVKGANPVRVILDPAAQIPSGSQILRTAAQIPTIIVVTNRASKSDLDRLSSFHVDIVKTPKPHISIEWLLDTLSSRHVQSVMVEGGSYTNWEFIKSGLVDEIILTIAPIIAGGKQAASLVGGEGFDYIEESLRLRLASVRRHGDEIVAHYKKIT